MSNALFENEKLGININKNLNFPQRNFSSNVPVYVDKGTSYISENRGIFPR